jgi:hypothetical protein
MDARDALAGLSPLEQDVLVALALVDEATVSADELAGLAGSADVGWALDELRSRGLVRTEPAWRRALAATDRAQTILERAVELAETGRLSPESLLGLTAWALRLGHYREALAIVRAAEETLAVVRRVEAWAELLDRAQTAARQVGDREAEAWAARRLAALKGPAPGALARRVLTASAVAAAGVAGLVVGLVVTEPQAARADPPAQAVAETVVNTVTVAGPATTVTVPGPVETVTETLTETVRETVTETVTTTVTVTVEPPPPPPPIID